MSAFNGYMQGRNEGDKGGTIPRTPNHYWGTESLRRASRNSKNVISIFFNNTMHLLPKKLKFENGAPKLLLAPGAI